MHLIYFIVIFFIMSVNGNAYIGIGPLIPLLGSAIAYIFLGAILVLGFLFYPIKKLINYFKNRKKKTDPDNIKK